MSAFLFVINFLTLVLVLNITFIIFKMYKCRRQSPPQVARAYLTVEGEKVEDMDLKVNNILPINLVLEDKFDNVLSAPEVAPTWTVADVSLGSIEASADGMSAKFTPSGRLGQTQISALFTSGEQQIQGLLDLNLIAGDVAELILQPGTPEVSV